MRSGNFMKKFTRHLPKLLLVLAVMVIVAVFLHAVSNLDSGRELEDKKQLEENLRKAVVACYAIEGAYPPSIEYLVETYGIQYNREKYVIKYEYIGSNLIPDITVLDLEYDKENR